MDVSLGEQWPPPPMFVREQLFMVLFGRWVKVNVKDLAQDEKACPMCLVPFPDDQNRGDVPMKLLPCQHTVGIKCLQAWFHPWYSDFQTTCPLCGKEIIKEDEAWILQPQSVTFQPLELRPLLPLQPVVSLDPRMTRPLPMPCPVPRPSDQHMIPPHPAGSATHASPSSLNAGHTAETPRPQDAVLHTLMRNRLTLLRTRRMLMMQRAQFMMQRSHAIIERTNPALQQYDQERSRAFMEHTARRHPKGPLTAEGSEVDEKEVGEQSERGA